MKPYKLAPDIYVIENFITEDQQLRVLEFANSLSEEDWHKILTHRDFFYGKQYFGDYPDVFREITDTIKNIINSAYWDKVFFSLQRHKDGHSMSAHKDNHTKSDDIIRYGLCLYYNDDYEGGALNYPELNITHKPKARSLVIHGGNILHGTTKVEGDAKRYFSTCFIKGSADFPVTLNQDMFNNIEEPDGSFYY